MIVHALFFIGGALVGAGVTMVTVSVAVRQAIAQALHL
jgi:hypothetical protein